MANPVVVEEKRGSSNGGCLRGCLIGFVVIFGACCILTFAGGAFLQSPAGLRLAVERGGTFMTAALDQVCTNSSFSGDVVTLCNDTRQEIARSCTSGTVQEGNQEAMLSCAMSLATAGCFAQGLTTVADIEQCEQQLQTQFEDAIRNSQ